MVGDRGGPPHWDMKLKTARCKGLPFTLRQADLPRERGMLCSQAVRPETVCGRVCDKSRVIGR